MPPTNDLPNDSTSQPHNLGGDAARAAAARFRDEVVHPTPAGNKSPESTLNDSSGRPVTDGNLNRVAELFKPLTPSERLTARLETERDLSDYHSTDGGTVLEKLKRSGLSSVQQDRVLDVFAEVREKFLTKGSDGNVQPEQRNSYVHAIGELDEVLISANANHLTPKQAESAALGALLSDSVKSGWTKETGGNFFTHHLDGALAAEVVLQRHTDADFTANDISNVEHAILEHQIGPPKFMASAYASTAATNIETQRQKELTELNQAKDSGPGLDAASQARLAELTRLQATGTFVTPAERADLTQIEQLLGNPFQAPLERDERGGYRVAMSTSERQLLNKYVGAGTENWHVPSDRNSWDPITQVSNSGDSLDNYFPDTRSGEAIKGPFKIAALRGPLSVLPDSSLDTTIAALKDSADSCLSQGLVATGDIARAQARLAQQDACYQQARDKTGNWIEENRAAFEQQGLLKAGTPLQEIPYFSSEPNLGLKIPDSGATKEEKAAYANSSDVKLADLIHKHFVEELEKMRRTDGELQTSLDTVRGCDETTLASRRAGANAALLADQSEVKATDLRMPPLDGFEADAETATRANGTRAVRQNPIWDRVLETDGRLLSPADRVALKELKTAIADPNSPDAISLNHYVEERFRVGPGAGSAVAAGILAAAAIAWWRSRYFHAHQIYEAPKNK